MTALVVALTCAVLLLAVLVAGLLRSHAEILKALHDLGAGLELDRADSHDHAADGAPGPVPVTIDGIAPPRDSEAPLPEAVIGTTLQDEDVALPLVGTGDTLLAFLSSGCTTCAGFWDDFARGVHDVPGDARLVVVAQDLPDESESALRAKAKGDVPVVLSSRAWGEFEVPGSPYFVYVDGSAGRIVGEGSAASWRQVVDLLGQARADDAARADRIAGGGAHRQSRDEQALAAAGIRPGDPSLYTPAGDGS